jgi:hypothetical protein
VLQAEFAAARPMVTAGGGRASVRLRPAARYTLLENAQPFFSPSTSSPRIRVYCSSASVNFFM